MSTVAVFRIPLWKDGCPRSLELHAIGAWPADRITHCPVMFAADACDALSWSETIRRVTAFRPRIYPSISFQAQVIREALEDAAAESGRSLEEFNRQLSNDERRQIIATARAELRQQTMTTPA
jgi:hypothetical protein